MTQTLQLPPSYAVGLSVTRVISNISIRGPTYCVAGHRWCGQHFSGIDLRQALIHRGAFHSRMLSRLSANATMNSETGPELFQGVVVAGTFDRLHQGHIQLLNAALSRVAKGGFLVVGISNGPLLANKSLRELIEPFEIRSAVVEQYLKGVAELQGQSIDVRCIEIVESAPQTAVEDPKLDCIVVSQETEQGAIAFNKCRVAIGLSPLKVGVVAILRDKQSEGEKWSSSLQRKKSLGTFTKRRNGERLSEGPLVTGPYMVGLTGGIAAGKSFVRKLLKDKGATVLDCDALGHLSYVQGTPAYQAIIKAFGESIVSPVDGAIDRQILGSIVFTDPTQMDILKKIVWEAVGNLVAEKREWMAEQGVEIFVAEAALLLEAHWEKEMNEVWVVFAPQETSRQRLISRNQISDEEANKRIRSQMSSEERVALADVAIYNGWTEDETRELVDKAWDLLLQRVRLKSSLVCAEKVNDPLWFRWSGLMRRLGIKEAVALKWWPKLVNSYNEPWRHYHTLMHLGRLYALFHEYAHYIAEPRTFQLAIFFHRIIYHPSGLASRANELSSAATFEEFAAEAGLSIADRERVKGLIMLGEKDVSIGGSVDMGYFRDFNLAVLGSSSEDFREFKTKLRQEFQDYDDQQFNIFFKDQLSRCVSQRELFHTQPFRTKYFGAAHVNIFGGDSLQTLAV